MTTITYRDGVFAADSASSRGEYRCAGSVRKLFRTREGVLGFTGNAASAMPLVDWLTAAKEPAMPAPVMSDKACVVHIKASGQKDCHEDGGVLHPEFEFMAWGSGMAAALGAMYAGATAEEAVKIAAQVDPWTGGEVVAMKV